jgi:hypothetical protein
MPDRARRIPPCPLAPLLLCSLASLRNVERYLLPFDFQDMKLPAAPVPNLKYSLLHNNPLF